MNIFPDLYIDERELFDALITLAKLKKYRCSYWSNRVSKGYNITKENRNVFIDYRVQTDLLYVDIIDDTSDIRLPIDWTMEKKLEYIMECL